MNFFRYLWSKCTYSRLEYEFVLPIPFSTPVTITSLPPLHIRSIKIHFYRDACIYPIALPRAGYDTRSVFQRNKTGPNWKISFSLISRSTQVKEPSLSADERIVGFIPFPRVLSPCEIQTTSSTIWIRVTEFISHNSYATSPSTIYRDVLIVQNVQPDTIKSVLVISKRLNTHAWKFTFVYAKTCTEKFSDRHIHD